MTRNTILILSIALIGILSAIVLKQRSTIESLRHGETVATESPEPVQPSGSLPPEVPHVTPPFVSTPSVSQVPTTISAPTSAPIAVFATNRDEDLRKGLEVHVQQLQAELEQVKHLVPEPEDASAAYVGPGTWANVELRTDGTKKIVIAGEARGRGTVATMSIKGWGACLPVDCEWPEVPFYLLDRFDGPSKYRRGFAVWEYESGSRTYLLITFEKSGLRIDKVKFRHGKAITPYSVVERMTRIQ
jgi:hypothetical protein